MFQKPYAALALAGLLACAPSPREASLALARESAEPPAPAARPAPAAQPVPASRPAVAGPVLAVRETAGIARRGEVVRTGVPLPRAAAVTDPRRLAVVDGSGRAVPAQLDVLARWNAGRDDARAPVQWLLVAFPATVAAGGTASYRLVLDGSAGPNPAPARPLAVRRDGDGVRIDTGAAVFTLSAGSGALFDEVALPGGARLAHSGRTAARVEGRDSGGTRPRGLRIERAGPLAAVVVVDEAYDLPAAGDGGFGSRRRYVFTAGSPTAVVRRSFAWEGTRTPGCKSCLLVGEGERPGRGDDEKEEEGGEERAPRRGQPNGVLVERLRDTLDLDLGGPLAATVVGGAKEPALTAALAPAEVAWLRQRQRPERSASLAYEARAGSKTAAGTRADGGLLAASGARGAVALALDHMHRYEPQALRLAGGALAADLVDDHVWLASHQGLFATLAVAALPPSPSRADLERLLWAPLDRPLRAWPDAAWFAGSEAVAEVPSGRLAGKLAAYDRVVRGTLERTAAETDGEGLAGLLTFGLYPRYWGEKWGGEIGCKPGKDPTPDARWDDVFWCTTWTDYHDTLATAAVWAMKSGEVEWLDEVAFPGALRMLHTQVQQCGPEDGWFYCGQAPSGYGGYRRDFNSSHAYFENLFLYYWLTGDSTVVDVLRRGGESMRRRLCASRGREKVTAAELAETGGPPGPACAPDLPSPHASFTGRVDSQWLAAFRFLGLASGDASFLDDFRSGLARAVTLHYAELVRGGRRYGFLGKQEVREPGTVVAGPIGMTTFYDAENLNRLAVDTGDAPIGVPAVRPSAVLAALARTMAEIEPRAGGGGRWPLELAYTWSGSRLGGTLVEVAGRGRPLYGPEKAGMAALLVRAGRRTGDPVLLAAGEELVRDALSQRNPLPLGKLQGQYLTRLHPAVALLAGER